MATLVSFMTKSLLENDIHYRNNNGPLLLKHNAIMLLLLLSIRIVSKLFLLTSILNLMDDLMYLPIYDYQYLLMYRPDTVGIYDDWNDIIYVFLENDIIHLLSRQRRLRTK